MRNITFERDRLAVLTFDRRDGFIRRRLVAGVADDDAKTARRSGNRRGAADAAAPAGDDYNLIRQNRPR